VFASLEGDAWHIVSFSIYGASLVILYLASTLFHSVQKQSLRNKLNIFDHAAIYILIAGTYTSFFTCNPKRSMGVEFVWDNMGIGNWRSNI